MIRGKLSSHFGGVRFRYAAPVIQGVYLRHPWADKRHPYALEALIDTGASSSLVPLKIGQSLGLFTGYGNPEDFRGIRSQQSRYYISVETPGIGTIPLNAFGVERVDGRELVLLGRDFLSLKELVLSVDYGTARWWLTCPSRWQRAGLWLLGLA